MGTQNRLVAKVNVDNFVRAHTAAQIDRFLGTGGVMNKWCHSRRPTPLDSQSVIRMNRDTLYSLAVVDISEGAILTLPDSGDRYMSVMVVNEDEYVNRIIHGGGTYELTMEEFDTFYVVLAARTLVNPVDPEDVKAANALQGWMRIEAVSALPYCHADYDQESYEATYKPLLELSKDLPGTRRTFGRKEEVTETRHLLGAAFGWGGVPIHEAFYVTRSAPRAAGEFRLTVQDVPVDGAWSISVYNADGYFEENEFDSYGISSLTAEPNEDGSVDVDFGESDDGATNFLYVMDGWNYVVRPYRPHEEVLEGKWVFPEPQAVR